MNLSAAAKLDDVNKHNGNYSRRDQMDGNRPSPLKINRESFLIQKPGSNSSSFSRMGMTVKQQQQQHVQRQAPVIIYTQSPKVIHTQPRDFMALVQKLTGLSRSDNQHVDHVVTDQDQSQHLYTTTTDHADHHHKTLISNKTSSSVITSRSHDDNESSSILTDENDYEKNVQAAVSSSENNSGYSPNIFSHQQSNPYFGDIPLFTPTSTSAYRYSNSTSQYASSPNVAGSLSPSLFEFIKGGLPEY